MLVHAGAQSPPATPGPSFCNNHVTSVSEVWNTTVTWPVSEVRMTT